MIEKTCWYIGVAAKCWAFIKLIPMGSRWIKAWLPKTWPESMTIEEAAAYAGVSAWKMRQVGQQHPEMVRRDGKGRNPRYRRKEVYRLLVLARKNAKS